MTRSIFAVPRRFWLRALVSLALLFSAAPIHSNTIVKLGSVRQISGPQDLDLDGTFAYAINFSTDDPVRKVGGVTFLPDNQKIPGATLVGPQSVTPWQVKPEFGNTPDANQLEEILADIRWANSGSNERLRATLVVTNGFEYKLQILISGNTSENRRWDIRLNGQEAVDEITSLGVSPTQSYSQNRATLYTCQFVATNNTVVVEMGNLFGINDGGDRNPIWQALTLELVYVPTAPDDVTLSSTNFFASQTAPVGAFKAVDAKSGATHTFALAAGTGDADNAKFTISGTNLLARPYDFSKDPDGASYSIRVRATDTTEPARLLEKTFVLTLAAPRAPTAIRLDAASLSARGAGGSLAAIVRVDDPDPFDRHQLSLVPGEGDAQNDLFILAGNELRLSRQPPAGLAIAHLRLRAADLTGLPIEASFALPVVTPRVRINEMLTGEAGALLDESGAPQDWIELRNEQSQWVDLAGCYLTDSRNNLKKWRFPFGSIAPNGFLVILADEIAATPAGSTNLHANFSLSSSGQWVGFAWPDGAAAASQLDAPEFFPGASYGVAADGQNGYFPNPTPGSENSTPSDAGRNEVAFSLPHGFYTNFLTLELSATLTNSIIRYTTDGSLPTATTGTIYTAPISVRPDTAGVTRGVRIIRALALNPRAAYSPVETQTYLFINGVTAPATDGVVAQSRLLTAITKHATYGPLLDDALLALPAVSVILPQGPTTAERLASVELFDPNQAENGFQIDCGINSTGTTSLGSPKLSMAAKFRFKYGRSKLRYPVFARGSMVPEGAASEFKELRLRSHSHDTFFWLGTRENPPVPYGNPPVTRSGDAQLVRNPWIDEMQLQMGQPGKHGRQVHLYLNGAYHGIYHIHEHPDDAFLASYYPGDSSQFHWTTAAVSGSDHGGGDNWRTSWNAMKSSLGNYTQAQRWVDVTNLCDYLVLNFYAGNDWDWSANHNWAAAGPKAIDRGGWKFFDQDSDVSLQDVNANCTDQDVPDGIFTALMRYSDFRVLFRDRVYKHCFNGGVLARAGEIYDARMNEIYLAIVAETARWQPSSSVSPLPWDRDQEWTNEWTYLRNTFFPQRPAKLIQQLKGHAGWWPADPPEFSKYSGTVPAGFILGAAAKSGLIYLTTDGSDPRLSGGAINPQAIKVADTNAAALIDKPMTVRARVYLNGDWSALAEANLLIGNIPAASAANLVISEIQYHPLEDADNEFVELLNTSSEPLDLSGVALGGAVTYRFQKGAALGAGERIVVANDLALFAARYGAKASPYYREGIRLFGPWSGSLSNDGETIDLLAPDDSLLFRCAYGVSGAWPREADGRGSSLELKDPAAAPLTPVEKSAWLGDPAQWRASWDFFGSPGAAGTVPPPRIVLNELLAAPLPGQMQAVELKNVSSSSVDLSGWFLSDSSGNYRKYKFSAGTVLPAARWLVLNETNFNRPGADTNSVPFLFKTTGDDAYLVEANANGDLLRFADRLAFDAPAPGVSLGRFPDGAGPFLSLKTQTFGFPNADPSSGYDAWAATAFPTGTARDLTAPGADPDRDGISNFAEYAFALSPTHPDSSPLKIVSKSNPFSFSYPTRDGFTYRVELSTDLAHWDQTESQIEKPFLIPQSDGTLLVIARLRPIPSPTPPFRFIRLVILP